MVTCESDGIIDEKVLLVSRLCPREREREKRDRDRERERQHMWIGGL